MFNFIIRLQHQRVVDAESEFITMNLYDVRSEKAANAPQTKGIREERTHCTFVNN